MNDAGPRDQGPEPGVRAGGYQWTPRGLGRKTPPRAPLRGPLEPSSERSGAAWRLVDVAVRDRHIEALAVAIARRQVLGYCH